MAELMSHREGQLRLGSLFDGLYSITDDGQLFSNRNNKWLKPNTDKYGYYYYIVSISGKRFTVKPHRAVAECFIPNPDNKPTVDHIDGNRKNNRVENLRWATWREQQLNLITIARLKKIHDMTDYRAMGAKRNFGRRKTVAIKNGVVVGVYESLIEASKDLKVCYSKASQCANGTRKTTGGYKFCYV